MDSRGVSAVRVVSGTLDEPPAETIRWATLMVAAVIGIGVTRSPLPADMFVGYEYQRPPLRATLHAQSVVSNVR